jgi:hypothetical protein
MLSGDPFYHRLTRKYVLAFGSMFNNITMRRYDQNYDQVLNIIKVPVVYGPREKWYARTQTDPDLNNPTQVSLPRISFEDVARVWSGPSKLITTRKNPKSNTASTYVDSMYVGTPYELTFQLYVWAKTNDDCNQIIEQIIPFFAPEYTVSLIPVPEMGFVDDCPISLDAVQIDREFEGDFETTRLVIATLSFTMKVNYYGPVTPRKIIKTAFANTYLDPKIKSGATVRMYLDQGNSGGYKLDEIVYQGRSLSEATAAGIVLSWNSSNNQLMVAGAQGTFRVGQNIISTSTNANHQLVHFENQALKLTSYRVSVDPITAMPGDDFGYDDDWIEFPDTGPYFSNT